jgi:sugar phosphate isomerase/epimerase
LTARVYGMSTHLYQESRLCLDHFAQIAAHGFTAVEVFASRLHFDYHDEQAIGQLAEWLAQTGLSFHSMHAPIFEGMKGGRWVGSYSNASNDDARRKAAIAETTAALAVARRAPYRHLVVHLGMPVVEQMPPGDNQTGAAKRSVEEIVALASDVGVGVALEVIPNPLSSASTLVRLIEEDLDGINAGICLDYGHAHLMGDLGDAIETISGHLWSTHIHDNGGKRDDHLVPFSGSINWETAIMETQKIGYEGTMMFEVADTGDPRDVLKRTAAARDRLDKLLLTFDF